MEIELFLEHFSGQNLFFYECEEHSNNLKNLLKSGKIIWNHRCQ